MILFSIGRMILPDSKFKEFLKKKFRKQISADTNKKLFGIATNRPQQTKESVDYTLKLLERCSFL
jgi:hypothetical protein